MTKLEKALQIEQEELELTPDRERIDVILDPERIMHTTCPSFYDMPDHQCYKKNKIKDYHLCANDWNEEI